MVRGLTLSISAPWENQSACRELLDPDWAVLGFHVHRAPPGQPGSGRIQYGHGPVCRPVEVDRQSAHVRSRIAGFEVGNQGVVNRLLVCMVLEGCARPEFDRAEIDNAEMVYKLWSGDTSGTLTHAPRPLQRPHPCPGPWLSACHTANGGRRTVAATMPVSGYSYS
jgi:hypothetical protein